MKPSWLYGKISKKYVYIFLTQVRCVQRYGGQLVAQLPHNGIKIPFLHSHLPPFHESLGAVSDEHVRNFTRTLLLLKRGLKESGQLEYSPNTVGH